MTNPSDLQPSARVGSLQPQRGLAALSPSSFSIEERDTRQWLHYLKQFSAWLQFHSTDPELADTVKDWSGFIPDELINNEQNLADLIAWLESNNSADNIPPDNIRQLAARPDLALVLTILQLLRHPRRMFQSLTERHLLYYYRDVLGLSEKPAEPDQAHLQVLLAEDAEPLVLPAGTLFEAGNNSAGEPRYYRLEQPAGLNHARVQTLRSLALNRSDKHTGFIRTDLIDQTNGVEFPEGGTLTFGIETITDPEHQQRPAVGLALGSPLLWLSEGTRRITLKFDQVFITELQRLDMLPEQFLKLFTLSVSTADGMVLLDDHEHAGISMATSGVSWTITLQPLFPPVTTTPEPVHRRLTVPYIQLGVKPDDNQRLQHYETLRRIGLEKIRLEVDVEGLTQLQIRNDQGLLDPAGPMELFGSRPLPRTRLQFSHPELALKPLTSLTINPQWNRPDDFVTRYQNYQTYLRHTRNQPDLIWPQHTISFGSAYGNTSNTDLFPANSTALACDLTLQENNNQIYPQGLEWSRWEQLPHDNQEPRDWPFWFSLQLGDDDFGHSIYTSVASWFSRTYGKEYNDLISQWNKNHTNWQSATQNYNIYLAELNSYNQAKARWDQLTALDNAKDWFSIIATGGTSSKQPALYDQFGRTVRSGSNEGLNVSVWHPATKSWSHTHYDIADDASAAGNLRAFMQALSADKTVVLYTGYHSMHSQRYHAEDDVVATIENFGGSSARFKDQFGYHRAYLLIGRKGLGAGKGFEQVSSGSGQWLRANISRGSDNQLKLDSVSTSQPLYGTPPNPGPQPQAPAVLAPPGPEPVQPVAPDQVEVKEPWTPLVDNLTVDYTAVADIPVENAGVEDRHTLLHVHPLGSQSVRDAEQQTLLPALDQNGYLYIGISRPPSGGSIDLQFQLAPVDSSNNVDNAAVQWSYLAGNRWEKFITNNQQESGQRAPILADNTNGLVDSGIIRFGLEPAMTRDRGFPGDDQLWLRASISNNQSGPVQWSRLQGISSQAIVVSYDNSDNPPDHLPAALPAETINGVLESSVDEAIFAVIDSVTQPWPSFGGRPPEADAAFTTRVSERLRHRGRALTAWDYERLVLEQFPDILLAHCLRGEQSGEVRLLVVPRTTDPALLKPRASRDIRQRIERYLQPLMPPRATLSVEPPVFQEVRFDITLTFHPEYDPGLVLQNLNQELIDRLNPWAEGGAELQPEMAVSDIVAFVASRPYVELVLKVLVETLPPQVVTDNPKWIPVTDGVVRPVRSDIILVPASRHTLSALPSGSKVFEGIGLMEIEYDFIVPDIPVTGISNMVIGGDGQPGPDGSQRPTFTVSC
ncbi:baseplate J/gp47 family protein [Endozoicomonadaceae bacterium StTr2]